MSWPIADLKGMELPYGFTLKEDGPDFFCLLFEGEKVQTFSSFGVTPDEKRKEIQKATWEYLHGKEEK